MEQVVSAKAVACGNAVSNKLRRYYLFGSTYAIINLVKCYLSNSSAIVNRLPRPANPLHPRSQAASTVLLNPHFSCSQLQRFAGSCSQLHF